MPKQAIPVIESYGPPDGAWWIRIHVGKRTYEYQAGHPKTISAIRGLFKLSPWKALNLAKEQCKTVKVVTERIGQEEPIESRPQVITVTEVREPEFIQEPLPGLLDILDRTGQDATYKFKKFFLYRRI